MKKPKGINKAVEKFNEANQTARIFLDRSTLRVECRLYINPTDGRFDFRHSNETDIISKEIEYGTKNSLQITPDILLQKVREEIDEE